MVARLAGLCLLPAADFSVRARGLAPLGVHVDAGDCHLPRLQMADLAGITLSALFAYFTLVFLWAAVHPAW